MATVAETLSSANDLLAQHNALLHQVRTSQRTHRRNLRALSTPNGTYEPLLKLPVILSPQQSLTPSPTSPIAKETFNQSCAPDNKRRRDIPPAKRARAARYANYVPEEETIRNDYSQRYVDGGEWPQNWVLGAEPERRFEEYPKQQRLLSLKKESVNRYAIPPLYLPLSSFPALLQPRRLSHSRSPSIQTTNIQPHPSPSTVATALSTTAVPSPSPSLKTLALPTSTIPGTGGILNTATCSKFDVILIDPPFSSSFSWQSLQDLPVPSLAADPSFVFLWVGSGAGEGLEKGREVLGKWGYRRCEDVCWIKTNKDSNRGPGTDPPTTSLLTRTKQHCLIGIRGTVRRSTDSWFVHCNVDTDVIIWEGDPTDPTLKPPEMYTLIENFCLGVRRLELFGRARSVRRGWVTVLADGEEERIEGVKGKRRQDGDEDKDGTLEEWEREIWEARVKEIATKAAPVNVGGQGAGKAVVPMTPEIDALRPKSPVRGGAGGAKNPSGTLSTSTSASLGNMSMPLAGSPSMGAMQKMVGMGMGGGRPGNGSGGFKNPNNTRMGGGGQNQMNMTPTGMGGMGMNGMGMIGMGIGGGDGMWGGSDGMGGEMGPGGMNPMGNMLNMGSIGNLSMGGMGNMSMSGMGNMGMEGMGSMMGGGGGFGGYDQQWDEGSHGGMWDDGSGVGTGGGVGSGGATSVRSANGGGMTQGMAGMPNIGGMQGMANIANMGMNSIGDFTGMRMGSGMNSMGMQGMGMGQMGHGQQRQWNGGAYSGYQ